jgi:hypothetical protein
MNRQKWILLAIACALMAGTAGLLAQFRTHQQLSPPGIKTHALPGSIRLQADLPERVLDYTSELVEVDDLTLNTLPADTSFGQRRYRAPDGFGMALNVVLMGSDRTSLHKPQFCLEGQGLQIDDTKSMETTIHIARPSAYDLPVVRLVANGEVTVDGQRVPTRAVYVYWYVADDALSATKMGAERMWLMGKRLVCTGVLQRWAYVSCLALCGPGQEEATFDRMKTFIAAAVPEFQLYPGGTNK